ncbi:vitamin K epoxide reductase family protein [Aeromicrobium panaciterrae]|uniref:vitamin K epoxide reductase family protein n=1 Tax=Aeromicrobium panaciterrae TaxID=363861 RepID=UPI0031D861B5
MTEQTVDTVTEPTYPPRWLLLLGGAIGLVASIVLTIDKARLSDDPTKTFSCDINAFVSCAGVMASDQASAFGFPNSYIGIAGFAGVTLIGLALLLGVRVPSFVKAGLWLGTLFGIGLVTWLQFQSIYEIGKLCPYCMVVWAVMIPLFVLVTAWILREFHPTSSLTRFFTDWTVLIIGLWYVAVAAAIWFEFGSRLWA